MMMIVRNAVRFSGLPLLLSLLPALSMGQNKPGSPGNQNACAQIRKACIHAGFSPGPGLRKNCLQPILNGQSNSGLPQVDPAVVASCNSSSPTAASANSAVAGAGGGGATLPQGGKGKRGLRPGSGANGHGANGLTPQGNGTVYDSNQNVYWLADANLAGNAQMRQTLGAGLKINPDGTMDYSTALLWVQALNNYNGKKGYLGHNKWQLPVTPAIDTTCSSRNTNNFGANCTGSALGNLYTVGLGKPFPDSVVPDFSAAIGPLNDVQPSLYWTLDTNGGGETTFSFLSDIQAGNTTTFNYMHVLATLPGAIGGQAPAGSGVVAYTSGKAAGKAIYDAGAPGGGRTWLLDANLARSNQFGITGTATAGSKGKKQQTLTVPLIDKDGSMLFETANNPQTGWVAAMNKSNYAGASNWAIPHYADLQALFKDLALSAHDTRLVYQGSSGPFQHLQPFFYWACERAQNGSSQSPCDPNLNPPPSGNNPMAWSFNLDNGFEGTSQTVKPFYVMVYYPASSTPAPTPRPTPPGKCGTPRQCCMKAGGTWVGNRCE